MREEGVAIGEARRKRGEGVSKVEPRGVSGDRVIMVRAPGESHQLPSTVEALLKTAPTFFSHLWRQTTWSGMAYGHFFAAVRACDIQSSPVQSSRVEWTQAPYRVGLCLCYSTCYPPLRKHGMYACAFISRGSIFFREYPRVER